MSKDHSSPCNIVARVEAETATLKTGMNTLCERTLQTAVQVSAIHARQKIVIWMMSGIVVALATVAWELAKMQMRRAESLAVTGPAKQVAVVR